MRAEKILQARLFAHPKVDVIWNAELTEVTSAGEPPVVDGVMLRDVRSGAARRLDVGGLFVAIGHTPNTSVFRGQVELDAEGYVVTPPRQHPHLGAWRVRRR